MSKETVFLSHSTKDGEILRRLKTLLEAKTHGTVRFFLSCDGQSIPFGRNWVSEIENALDASTLLFCFITPQSLNSNWLHFESGFAYARKAKVVPVGLAGVNLGAVPPPLQLLQGFNVNDHHGLNNILTVINEDLESSHPLSFTEEDFGHVVGHSELSKSEHTLERTLDTVEFQLCFDNPVERIMSALQKHQFDPERSIEHGPFDEKIDVLTCPGLVVQCSAHFEGLDRKSNDILSYSAARIEVEPAHYERYCAVFEDLRLEANVEKAEINCLLNSSWKWLTPRYRLLAKFLNSDVIMDSTRGCSFQGHGFSTPDENRLDWGKEIKRAMSIEVASSFTAVPLLALVNCLIRLGGIVRNEA